MLRKSVYWVRYGALITALSILLYLYNPDIGKYVLGLGLIVVAMAVVFYIFFMFRRYGEKKPVE